ncbi:hypothetical protein SESBI_48147 [Sesbania bispinosa]|nr:hypothetical protein SESBI_48147 [Sesbania bispinosa]
MSFQFRTPSSLIQLLRCPYSECRATSLLRTTSTNNHNAIHTSLPRPESRTRVALSSTSMATQCAKGVWRLGRLEFTSASCISLLTLAYLG